MRFLRVWWLMVFAVPAWAAHGYALWDDLKYAPGFQAFDYVDPAAPKGGELRLVSNLRVSTFDKYNPFTIKGAAPAYLDSLLFDTLAGRLHGRDRVRLRPAGGGRHRGSRPPQRHLPPAGRRRSSTTACRSRRPT
jgi:hypothetical protein